MIILDLDGVIADFTAGACEIHGRPGYRVTQWDWFKEWGISGNAFWKPIKEVGMFYQSFVTKFPWTDELLGLLRGTGEELVIATANPFHPGLMASKTRWIIDNVGTDIPVMIGNCKHLLAQAGRVLIDDCDANEQKFREFGGDAILFPQLWNENADLVDRRLSYISYCLRNRGYEHETCKS